MGGLRNNGQSDGKVRVVCGYVYVFWGAGNKSILLNFAAGVSNSVMTCRVFLFFIFFCSIGGIGYQ